MGRVRLQVHLSREEGDPTPPWPGDEFLFDVELALESHRPRGRRSFASAGEPPEPGGWELRRAACRAINGGAEGGDDAARVCGAWLWAASDTPLVREAIDRAIELHRERSQHGAACP